MCFSSSQVSILHCQQDVLILFSCDCFFDRILSCFCHMYIWLSSLFTKKTSVTGQQLALWLLTDLLFSLFWGASSLPSDGFFCFKILQSFPKVAQCVVPMEIRYISYVSSTISGLDHCTWSPQDKSQSQLLHTSLKCKKPKHKQKAKNTEHNQ